MDTNRFVILALAALTLMSARPSDADALLAGVKTSGMAATSTAYPIDAFAGAYNPAAITELCDRFDTGITWLQDYQSLNIHDNSDPLGLNVNGSRNAAKTSDMYVPEFGINKNYCFDFCNQPLQFSTGFIVYNRNFLKTTYGRPIELLGTTKAGLEFLHQTIAALFALRFSETQSVGLSINYNCQRLKVNGLQYGADPSLLPPLQAVFAGSISPEHCTNKGYNYSNGVGVTIGYLGRFFDRLRIGAAFQPQCRMTRFGKYKGFIAERGKFNNPWRFITGISYEFTPSLTAAFDYEYVNWQSIRMLKNPTFPNLTDYLFGTKNGAGFGWKNQSFFRLGVNWKATECWELRAGFRHVNTPIKAEYTAVNLLTMDTLENFLSFGTTYYLNRYNEISAFYAVGFQNIVKGRGSIPFLIGGGNADLKQAKRALGISWGYHF